jgi:hypothetical protein
MGPRVTGPRYVDAILAFGAAAVGVEPDSLGYIIFGVSVHHTENAPLTLLEWEIEQLSAATLGRWVPKIFNRIEELAGAMRARTGGLTLDPEGVGRIIFEQASAVYPVDLVRNERILEMTMPQRAVAASAYVYSEFVVLGPEARKSSTYKGKTANHLTRQVGAFGVNTKPDAAGALLVSFANGILEIFDSEAMRHRTSRMVPLP